MKWKAKGKGEYFELSTVRFIRNHDKQLSH